MAKILCVCISKERKTSSQNIHECEADLQGLVAMCTMEWAEENRSVFSRMKR